MSKAVENKDKVYLEDPFSTGFTIADLDKAMLENGDWTLLEFINWAMIKFDDLEVRYDKAIKRYGK